jgi:ribonuclease G
MGKEICISSTPHETRLAILEDDQLAEIYYERENEYTLAGSIYNGRVTRVLPGMQSAFVDVGLERDAFLYVTDFLELEDQEESDELEKAAASSPNQPPREVRHGGDRSGQRDGQKQDQKQERVGRDRRPTIEVAPETGGAEQGGVGSGASGSLVIAEQTGGDHESSDEHGAKRWRGRRRRRGGRGGSAEAPAGQAETEESTDTERESAPEPKTPVTHEIRAGAAPMPRAEHAPAPFVLPGESLSRYGGAPAEEQKQAAPAAAAPARPAPTYKPSTLIEAPIVWDGSGLLPGESLSKHRNRQPESQAEVGVPGEGISPDAIEEQALFEEVLEQTPSYAEEPGIEGAAEVVFEPEAPEYTIETVFEAPSADESVAQAMGSRGEALTAPAEDAATESAVTAAEDSNATASHRFDPNPPTSFRLFGLGGKRKTTTEEPVQEAAPEVKPATVASVSAFAPGSGLIEEEVIEGEEYETPGHPHHKADEHDLDEYEEETLQTQIRSGELGEMLQEAHLDHRIQLKFEDKNGEDEDEESFDSEEEDEEPAVAEGQPAAEGATQPRRDRQGRGRRGGRGGPGGQRPGDRRPQSRRSAQTSDLPIISDLLKPGQEILVQIAKEPIAKKGARITSHIALPGRFLVFMPTVSHVGVSRKIASDDERLRLKRILISERGEATGGFIVRTAAEGASEEELRSDLRFLIHLWAEIKQRSDSSKSPALIYHDLSLIERILRDQVSANFSSIWVDSQDDYERIVRFLNRFSPNLVRRVKLYTKETPLFEHFGIQDEISKALRSKVWLKSGGSIVINQTEALVAIDINTGKYVGKSARLEDTIVKTNLDAVPEIVRQIRLRDLGGIIIIDFIDMDERKNRFRVMAALEEALKSDRAPTKVLQFNDFGLVAITRKRVKQSLERTLSVPCPTCQATGMVKSPATVCNEIYIELRKMRKHFENADVLLRVNPETVKVLKGNNSSWLTEFEELVGKNILVKSDATLHPEQFDIQG